MRPTLAPSAPAALACQGAPVRPGLSVPRPPRGFAPHRTDHPPVWSEEKMRTSGLSGEQGHTRSAATNLEQLAREELEEPTWELSPEPKCRVS
ncbi:Histone acetyltransferase [Frankliniella fusca]|uniref:Histone acetyltransferase n=1 Tax=Frankliniella fusca TaxID=407009 RepID=A0AAE1HMG9_9NEOP|nr:Histone acetyltransferase [Frankliniella fusca]